MLPKEEKILIKILQQEKKYGMKRLLADSGRSMTSERSTDKLTWQWKKTKSYLN